MWICLPSGHSHNMMPRSKCNADGTNFEHTSASLGWLSFSSVAAKLFRMTTVLSWSPSAGCACRAPRNQCSASEYLFHRKELY